ncbi:MAG: hypothetical protein ACU0BK_06200 [Shimia sp.]|uniref:hypothetical protein n=1 Tax=Shimia sp. TaxID=1954381 RepID=UPI004058443A
MSIPRSRLDQYGNASLFPERLASPQSWETEIGEETVRFFYETPREGWVFGCSPEDVVRLLEATKPLLPYLPGCIVFRQPTNTQAQQEQVWGRFLYWCEIGAYFGDALVLEAIDMHGSLKWHRQMSLDDRAEFDRLTADGHRFEEGPRRYTAALEPAPLRNTVLYRTVLHELGHMVDYCDKVLWEETALDSDQDRATELYFARPAAEREAFAHRFAQRARAYLEKEGAIPFAPVVENR